MRRILKILVGVLCLCSLVKAQTRYDSHPITQTVQYDDDEPSYHQHTENYGLARDSSLGEYTNKYGEQHAPAYYRPVSSPYPQPHSNFPNSPIRHASYYPQKAELPLEKSTRFQPNEPAYHQQSDPSKDASKAPGTAYGRSLSEDHKETYEQPEELQYSHEPEERQPSPAQETSYPHGTVPYQPAQQSNKYHSSAPEGSYPPAASTYQSEQQLNKYPASAPEASYPKASESYRPSSPNQRVSLVKRDPKLPLYFTMYEKRIIQDPTDKYGKGPWRYLTYGHGITYGSKEPGKVFEKGYGYIRALGRDHCKLPENQCPPRDDKPFEYDGRKEPYFGYRPH